MALNATGEDGSGPLRLHFGRSVKLAFRGSAISPDGALLLHRELDDALGLTDQAAMPWARSTGAVGSPDVVMAWSGPTSSRPPACCSPVCPSGAGSRLGVIGFGSASASRRPRSLWPGSWPSSCIACGAMEPTSSGQARRRQPRGNNLQGFRESGSEVPVWTVASSTSTEALRGLIESSATSTLIRQHPPMQWCRGLSPYCGESSEPGRHTTESLTSNPRVREQPRLNLALRAKPAAGLH